MIGIQLKLIIHKCGCFQYSFLESGDSMRHLTYINAIIFWHWRINQHVKLILWYVHLNNWAPSGMDEMRFLV